MPKPFSPRNQCTDWFAPTASNKLDIYKHVCEKTYGYVLIMSCIHMLIDSKIPFPSFHNKSPILKTEVLGNYLKI